MAYHLDPVSEHYFGNFFILKTQLTILGAPTCCSTLKQIITFPFKVIYGLLSLIWNVLIFLFGTCAGWFFMIIFVSVGLFVYFYYYYFHCHGQVNEIRVSATNLHLIVVFVNRFFDLSSTVLCLPILPWICCQLIPQWCRNAILGPSKHNVCLYSHFKA